jgi:LmbE family N-acetylglucosaminyl deacetylase
METGNGRGPDTGMAEGCQNLTVHRRKAVFGKRILLLIPHPDDEVVGCFKAIGLAGALDAKIFGFYLTTGIPSRDRLWSWQRGGYGHRLKRRQKEALLVAKLLGIESVCFNEIPSRKLKSFLKPTRDALIHTIRRLGIDLLWVPAYEGAHQDHDTANFLANTLTEYAPIWEFSEYNFFNRTVRSQNFFSLNGTEKIIALDRLEQRAKRQAIGLYPSERGNLRHISTYQEMFRPLIAYDYTRPPHDEKLFYQRFQWIPGHPRIDYCQPHEVCLAFEDFLQDQQH